MTILTLPQNQKKLRQKSKPIKKITPEINQLVKEMITTADQNPEDWLGLAAPQVNIHKRLFIIKFSLKDKPKIIINPQIVTSSSEKTVDIVEKKKRQLEGCLSVPGLFGFVNRPYHITVKWTDLDNKEHQEELIYPESTYFQHEFDHLNGILFIDHILKQDGQLYQEQEGEMTEINL